MTPDEILKQVQNAAKIASEKLAAKNTKVFNYKFIIQLILVKFRNITYLSSFSNFCTTYLFID